MTAPTSGRARGIALTLGLAVLTAASLAAGVAAAPRGSVDSKVRAASIEVLREDLVLSVSPASLTICTGETATVSVALETQTTYRDSNDPASTLRTMTRPSGVAAVVRAASDSASTASVSPGFAPAIPPNGAARFTVLGGEPGRTVLRLSETQNASYRAQEIQVIVDDCYYMVDLRSSWQMVDGFQPDMLSVSVGTMVTRTATPGRFEGLGTSKNFAYGVPIGGCVPRFTVSDGTMTMKGAVADRVLTLEIEYRPVVADTNVVCLLIGGGRQNIATPRPLTITAPAYEDSSHNPIHILDASYPVPGDTWVRIQLIRIPS